MSNDTDEFIEAFVAARNAALSTMDMEYLRRMMPAASDEVRIIAAHKARYECKHLDNTLRHESAAWLRERGYGAMYGPLLPEGELPQ
jgi:hypothetical protein